MVTGIDSFKEWFKGYEEQYARVGGAVGGQPGRVDG